EEIEELDRFLASFDKYYQVGIQMANAYIRYGPEQGNILMTDFDQASLAINESIDGYVERHVAILNQDIDMIYRGMKANGNITLTIMLIGFALTGLASIFIFRSILRSLTDLQQHADIISSGDL